ncbi:hypothetical protein [Chryseobacterium oranimense]|nr:hypothetical protein [Chryseobacterium oranimense]
MNYTDNELKKNIRSYKFLKMLQRFKTVIYLVLLILSFVLIYYLKNY